MAGIMTVCLVGAFVLSLFSVFNTHTINVNMMEYYQISIPLSIFTFGVFLFGAVFSGSVTWPFL